MKRIKFLKTKKYVNKILKEWNFSIKKDYNLIKNF